MAPPIKQFICRPENSLGRRLYPAPLWSHTRVGEASNQFHESVPIACIRRTFPLGFRLQLVDVLRQNGVRQAGSLMMNPVKGFVEKTEGDDFAHPTASYNAAGRAIYGIAGHSDVLDVLTPALQVGSHNRWSEIQPHKIFP